MQRCLQDQWCSTMDCMGVRRRRNETGITNVTFVVGIRAAYRERYKIMAWYNLRRASLRTRQCYLRPEHHIGNGTRPMSILFSYVRMREQVADWPSAVFGASTTFSNIDWTSELYIMQISRHFNLQLDL